METKTHSLYDSCLFPPWWRVTNTLEDGAGLVLMLFSVYKTYWSHFSLFFFYVFLVTILYFQTIFVTFTRQRKEVMDQWGKSLTDISRMSPNTEMLALAWTLSHQSRRGLFIWRTFCVSGSAIRCYSCKDYTASCSKQRDCSYDDACLTLTERGTCTPRPVP